MIRPFRLFLSIVITMFAVFTNPVMAEKTAGDDAVEARTTDDPYLPVDELELKLRPLMQTQLKVEADAWLKLLEEKVDEISRADIAVKYKRKEIEAAEKLEDALLQLDEARKQAQEPAADNEQKQEDRLSVEDAERELAEAKIRVRDTVEKVESDTEIQAVIALATKMAEEKEKAESEARPDEAPKQAPEDAEALQGDAQAVKQKIDKAVEERNRDRAYLLDYLTELREDQTALVDRTNVVIASYEEKGGPVEEVEVYRQYITAVSGIAVDVSDMEATLKTVGGWLTSDEGGLRWLKNIALFVVILIIAWFIARLASKAVERLMARSRQTSQLLGDFLTVSVRRLVLALGVLVGLAAMEINIGPLLAVIGAAGFVIAFALQNSLGNFASGILIMVFKPFDIGDMVEVGGVLGTVKSMNLLSVLVYTPDNKAVIIPNNNVWSDAITNVTGTSTRRVDLIFGIGYDDDIEKARQIMQEVVSAHPLVLDDPEPVIGVHELADSSVNFVCRPWVKTADYWAVYWDITRQVKERFDAEGVSIPFPQRDVHVYNALPDSAANEPAAKASLAAPGASGNVSRGAGTELEGENA